MSEDKRAATREHHPSKPSREAAAPAMPTRRAAAPFGLRIPAGKDALVALGERQVRLTNLDKPFWPELGITKRDLLQYYADVARVLLPHLADRAMVMKRYPDGADGEFFFMKRAPTPRPEWIETCAIEHGSGNVIDFPMIQDLAVAALGRQSRLHRPEPVVRALRRRRSPRLPALRPRSGARTRRSPACARRRCSCATHSRPRHGAAREDDRLARHPRLRADRARADAEGGVDASPRSFALEIAARHPKLITAEYRVAKRPAGRVLVDYNQNAWGRTLASAYSARPRPRATGVDAGHLGRGRARVRASRTFDLRNMPARVAAGRRPVGAAARARGRFDLAPLVQSTR